MPSETRNGKNTGMPGITRVTRITVMLRFPGMTRTQGMTRTRVRTRIPGMTVKDKNVRSERILGNTRIRVETRDTRSQEHKRGK